MSRDIELCTTPSSQGQTSIQVSGSAFSTGLSRLKVPEQTLDGRFGSSYEDKQFELSYPVRRWLKVLRVTLLSCSDEEREEESSGGEEDVNELVEGGEVVDYVYSDSEDAVGPALPSSYEDEEDFDSLLF